VLLLNPDAELAGGLAELEAACSEPGVAAAAGLLAGEDGKPQRGFSVRRLPTAAALVFETLGLNRLWPSNPVNRRYRCLDLDLSLEQDVEQPAGAFLLFRRDAWKQLAGFDERFYPVWFEDADFCRRLSDAGYRVRFTPCARARHRGGHSFWAVSRHDRIVWWYRSLLKYASRHFRAASRAAVCGAVLASAILRMVTGMFTEMGSGGGIRVYGKVISLALACLWSGRAWAAACGVESRQRAEAAASSIQLEK
jgi:N-acetylglucosaminyl-diphospho-decaprenol L-rhamnosyltransferase